MIAALRAVATAALLALGGADGGVTSSTADVPPIPLPAAANTRAATRSEHAQAMARLRAGSYAEAAELFARAAARDPGNAALATDLGFALGRAGRRAEAEAVLRGAIEKDPHRYYAYLNLAELLAEDPARWERRDAVVAFLDRGLEALKDDRKGRFNLLLGLAGFERAVGRTAAARARLQPLLAPEAPPLSRAQRKRVLDLLASWNQGQAVRELQGIELDLAVARGASFYGRTRVTGKGIRIKAGASRSYYIGLETSMPAVPGFKPPVKALCIVPQGMQEGSELLIEGRDFGLLTGHPAEFRFFSSAVRSGDRPGQILPDAERELEDSSLLEINLPPLPDFPAGQAVPVQINSVVTELGTLELWMKHINSDRRWKVEFQVRTE